MGADDADDLDDLEDIDEFNLVMIVATDTIRMITATSTTKPKPASTRAFRREPGPGCWPISLCGSELDPPTGVFSTGCLLATGAPHRAQT